MKQMRFAGNMVSRSLASAAMASFSTSCSIYDGGGEGVRLKVGESATIVERRVTLVAVDSSSAEVQIGSSRRIHELTLGHCEPLDFSRGLVVHETNPDKETARITGFRITRTLNPNPPF